MASRQVPSRAQAESLAALRHAATEERNIERQLQIEWETFRQSRVQEVREKLIRAVDECDKIGVTQENMSMLGLGVARDRTKISRLVKEARSRRKTITVVAPPMGGAKKNSDIYVYRKDDSIIAQLTEFVHSDIASGLPISGLVKFELTGMTEEEGPLKDDIVSQMNLWALPQVQEVVDNG